MNVHLFPHLEHHSGFLQQICPHVGTDDAISAVEADLDVLAEAAAVVISGGLCVSDGLNNTRNRQIFHDHFRLYICQQNSSEGT